VASLTLLGPILDAMLGNNGALLRMW